MIKYKNLVYFALFIISFIWGINPTIMKIGLRYLTPFAYNFYRLIVSLIISFLVMLFSSNHKPVPGEDMIQMIFISIFGFFIFQIFLILGVNSSTAGNAALLMSLLPLIVLIINTLILKEAMNLKFLFLVLITIIGVVIVILGSGKKLSFSKEYAVGALLIFISEAGYGIYTVVSKKLSSKYTNYQLMTYILAVTTLLSIPISYKQVIKYNITTIPAVAWLSIIFSGALAVCLGNYTWIWAVKKIGSNKTSMFNNLQPIFGIFAAFIILGERMNIIQIIGALIIIVSLYLSSSIN